MPLYDYRCWNCGFIFEALVRSSAAHTRCPHCDNDVSRLDRMPSAPAAFPEADRWRNPSPLDPMRKYRRVINDIRRKG